MSKLTEGLRRGDLEDLVLPLISVDEYESRIDDSAIVVGFFVNEKDAAQDLNRFIQRSPVELLDTEISPAPDSHGYFMVFVELLNNGKLGESVEGILEEISSLTMIDSWKMKLRGHDDLLPFDAEQIEKTCADEGEPDPVRESALDLLSNSDLLDARFEADTLVMESARNRYEYHLKAVGSLDEVSVQSRILEGARLDFGAMIANRNLEFALGQGWTVYRFRDTDVLYHHETDRALALFPA